MGARLNKLYWLKQEITQLESEIKELSKLPDNLGNTMLLRSKLDKKLIEFVEERINVEAVINNIDDSEIRVIARKRYIENKSWERIGKEMYMDRTTAYKKLQRYENSHKK